MYRSHVLPGLWLDAAALLRGDLATVARVAQEGIGSAEHAAFVAKLQAAEQVILGDCSYSTLFMASASAGLRHRVGAC